MKLLLPSIGLSLLGFSLSLSAEEFESHDAHVHGAAKLQIVAEKNGLEMHFESPAMNIVGFEHDVENQSQANILKQALATLAKTDSLFQISGGGCHFTATELENPFAEEEHHDEHGHEESHHDEHDHHKEDSHDEHDHHKEDSHDEHDHHESEHSHEEAVHREFELEYKATCKDISTLSRIEFPILKEFEGIEKLDVQYVIQGKQGSMSVSKSNPYIDISN